MRYRPDSEGYVDVESVGVLVPAGSGLPVWPVSGWLLGWTITNLSAAAATLQLIDGADGNGSPLPIFAVAANATVNGSRGLPGLPLESGLFVAATGAPLTCTFQIGVTR